MIEYLFPFALRRRAELSGEANNRTSSPLRCKTGNPIDSRISNDTRDPLMPDAIDLALSAKRFRAWPWFRNRPSRRRFGSSKIKDSASWKLFLPTDEISRFSRRRIHILWIREIYARKFSAMKSVPAAHVSEPTRANCTNLRLFTSAGHWGVPQSHHQGHPTPPPPNELCISRDAFDSSPFLLPFARSQSTRKNTTNARTTFASRHHEIVLQRNSKEIRNFIYISFYIIRF